MKLAEMTFTTYLITQFFLFSPTYTCAKLHQADMLDKLPWLNLISTITSIGALVALVWGFFELSWWQPFLGIMIAVFPCFFINKILMRHLSIATPYYFLTTGAAAAMLIYQA